MKINLLFFIILVFITSCFSSKFLTEKDYVFNDNSKRKLTLTFHNDSTCILRNVFLFEKLEKNELIFKCRYKMLSNQNLILINDNNYIDTIGTGYFYFPNFKKSNSSILDRKNKIVIGPNYSTEYERYSKVPYVANDTLINYKGKLIWIKKDKTNKVVGYYEFR